MDGIAAAIRDGDNPAEVMARKALSVITPLQQWCVIVAARSADAYDPGQGRDELMELVRQSAFQAK